MSTTSTQIETSTGVTTESKTEENNEIYKIQPIHYSNVPARTTSIYPTKDLQNMVYGRQKRSIGSLYGIKNFGLNITTLPPSSSLQTTNSSKDSGTAATSIVHYHTKQDEMIYIISGTATVTLYHPPTCSIPPNASNGITDISHVETTNGTYEEIQMIAGDVIGFPAGRTIGHSIRNSSNNDESLVILEVGDRTPGDIAIYPEPHIDLMAKQPQLDDTPNKTDTSSRTSSSRNLAYEFFHKDGRPY